MANEKSAETSPDAEAVSGGVATQEAASNDAVITAASKRLTAPETGSESTGAVTSIDGDAASQVEGMFHFGSLGDADDADAGCELTFGDFSSLAVASSSAGTDRAVPSPLSSSPLEQPPSEVPVKNILGSEVAPAPPIVTEQPIQHGISDAPGIAAGDSEDRGSQPTRPAGATGSDDASKDIDLSAPEPRAAESESRAPKPKVSLKHQGSRARSSREASRDDHDDAAMGTVPRQSKTRSPPPLAQPSPQDAATGVFLTDAEILSSAQPPSQTARQSSSDSEAFNAARAEAWLRARWDVIEAKMREENPQGAC